MTHPPRAGECQISACTRPAAVYAGMSDWNNTGGSFCRLHVPTVEQALRRGFVADCWKVHGYYPAEIAARLTMMTGHNIRESTVRDDLRWMGLTEAHRNAEARLSFDLPAGVSVRDTNVVPLRRAK